jgi:hypothetical protein
MFVLRYPLVFAKVTRQSRSTPTSLLSNYHEAARTDNLQYQAALRKSDLKLNRKKFRKIIDTHTGGITYYINDE